MGDKHNCMAVEQPRVIDEDDLTDADRDILDELRAGARTKKAIVDETELHRNTVGNRLDVLEAGDVIKCIHETTALYELVDDPRRDDPDDTDRRDLLAQLDTVASERANLETKLTSCQQRLEDCQERLAQQDAIDTEAALRAIEDAEAAAERGNGNGLQGALERAREALDD